MSTCKTCKWLDVPASKSGRIVVRNAYPCIAPDPELPRIPAAMTDAYGWRWPPSRRYMSGKDGEGCPIYAYRDKTPNVEVCGERSESTRLPSLLK